MLETNWGDFIRAQLPGYILAAFVGLVDWAVLVMISDIDMWAEVGLVIMLAVSGIAYIIGFLCIPRSLMGDTPAWLIAKLSPKLPNKLGGWLQNRFATESV